MTEREGPDAREAGTNRPSGLTPGTVYRLERGGLTATGVLTVLFGGWFLYIALGLGETTTGDPDLRLLAGGVGAATVVAGVLAVAGRREDLVGSILGALTAAAFTLGATQLIQPESGWRVMFPAAIFGGLLLGFLAFRGAFRARTGDEG
jgi:hypothetical protein